MSVIVPDEDVVSSVRRDGGGGGLRRGPYLQHLDQWPQSADQPGPPGALLPPT